MFIFGVREQRGRGREREREGERESQAGSKPALSVEPDSGGPPVSPP